MYTLKIKYRDGYVWHVYLRDGNRLTAEQVCETICDMAKDRATHPDDFDDPWFLPIIEKVA